MRVPQGRSIQELVDQVIEGDVLEVAATLPDDFVHTIITSPPYWGHRKYLAPATDDDLKAREIGREATPQEYVERLVAVFRELRRALRPEGTLWLNLGDAHRDGQLLGLPWRTALALVDDGWQLRSEIIWHKSNAMPTPARGRPTPAHEHLFMLSRSDAYAYYADAIREPHVTFSDQSKMRGGRGHFGKRNGTPESGKNQGNRNLHDGRWDQAFHPLGRNKRTVWEIALGKFRDTHFAVYPEKLVDTCVRASTVEGNIVLDPFMGSGTTAVVAKRLGRRYVGVDLLRQYVDMASERVTNLSLWETSPVSAQD